MTAIASALPRSAMQKPTRMHPLHPTYGDEVPGKMHPSYVAAQEVIENYELPKRYYPTQPSPPRPVSSGVMCKFSDAPGLHESLRSYPRQVMITREKVVWQKPGSTEGREWGEIRLGEVHQAVRDGTNVYVHLKSGRSVHFDAEEETEAKRWTEAINTYAQYHTTRDAVKEAQWQADGATEEELDERWRRRVDYSFQEHLKRTQLRVRHRLHATRHVLAQRVDYALGNGGHLAFDEDGAWTRLQEEESGYVNALHHEYLRLKKGQRHAWYDAVAEESRNAASMLY